MELDSISLKRIVPVVKAVVLEESDATSVDVPKDDQPIFKPLAGDLIVMYAEDVEDKLVFISGRRMKELGLTLDRLHDLARTNLPSRVPKIEMHGASPCVMLTCGGNFEATLLLYDGLWEAMAESLPGEAMACVPSRDLLFASGSGWEGAYSFLFEAASKELEDKRYSLSKEVFIRRNGKWQVFKMAS